MDGRLTIFKRYGVYFARLRLSGSAKYLWRSLKTTNEQTAIDLGRQLLFQLEQRADDGLPAKSKSFSAVIDDYIAYRERDHRHGGTSADMLRQIIRVSKFWREYAGESLDLRNSSSTLSYSVICGIRNSRPINTNDATSP